MYRRIPSYPMNIKNNNDRFFGGFAVPFVLGGITGGLLAGPFYNNGRYQNMPMPPIIYQPPYYINTTYPTYTENYYYY